MYREDIQKGKINEERVHPIINRVFQTNFKETPQYALFDFKDFQTNTMVEVKSIGYKYGEVPSVMIGYNKIKYAVTQTKKGWDMWIVFSLKDGDYLYNFTEENKDWIKPYDNSHQRPNSRTVNYYWIPIKHLIKIEDDLLIVEV